MQLHTDPDGTARAGILPRGWRCGTLKSEDSNGALVIVYSSGAKLSGMRRMARVGE